MESPSCTSVHACTVQNIYQKCSTVQNLSEMFMSFTGLFNNNSR